MKITGIQKKNNRNISIILDSGEKLILSYELFLKYGLSRESDISEELFEVLKRENDLLIIRQKAFQILDRRVHSEWELKLKLLKRGHNKSLINDVIMSLQESGFLNDYNYSVLFRDEKMNRYGWGKELVSAALRKKGVLSEIIKEILADVPSEDLFQKAAELLSKKYRHKSFDELHSLKYKMSSYLSAKGYDYDTIHKAVEEYITLRATEGEII